MQFADVVFNIKHFIRKAWLIVKHRPLVKCPFCEGAGGAMSGYYEPEWTECRDCWDHWEELDDHGLQWFVGRMPIWKFFRAKISIRFGLWYTARIRDVLACKFGRHDWMNEDDIEPGLRICCVCYEDKHEPAEGRQR